MLVKPGEEFGQAVALVAILKGKAKPGAFGVFIPGVTVVGAGRLGEAGLA